MDALTVSTTSDELLALVAPFAVAVHQPTAIVVDLDRDGLALPGSRTLRDLVEDRPRLADLVPRRRGVVSLPNGGVDGEEALPVIEALRRGWPAMVLRSRRPIDGTPLVPVVPMAPDRRVSAAAWVRTGLADPGGEGPIVRGPSRSAIRQVMEGRAPSGWWVRSWAAVWSWPWR